MTFLFWCGNIILLGRLMQIHHPTFKIRLLEETADGGLYTYKVEVEGIQYKYTCMTSSNTHLEGTVLVEGDGWVSPPYTVDKTSDFVHISETASAGHDIYFVNNLNVIDIYMRNGRKSSISTMSITEDGQDYTVRPSVLPLQKKNRVHPASIIRNLFIIAAVQDSNREIMTDIVSYVGIGSSVVVYSTKNTQIMGIETIDIQRNESRIQCINSVFNQAYRCVPLGDNAWRITETVQGVRGPITKRSFAIQMKDSEIHLLDKGTAYSYHLQDGDITFTKVA